MEKRIKLRDKTFRVMIPAEDIDAAVERVAERLNHDYAGRTPVFLGVLSGAFLFLSDLVRKTDFNSQLAFVKISSYEGTQSTGKVQQQMGVDFDIEGRDIIIVEDIVETGHSMNYLLGTPACEEACQHSHLYALLQARQVPVRVSDRLCGLLDRQRVHRGLRTGLRPVGPQSEGYLRHRQSDG